MNIVLSAYACEPHKGSEPGVGWRWAVELAGLGHHVWVITRENNREHIGKALESLAVKGGSLHFIYYDLPGWSKWWKKWPGGVYLYYLLWQLGILLLAKKWTRTVRFDIVHHITFGVFRLPSFLSYLGIPLIFGPVGGGERAPRALRQGYPLRGRLLDFGRDVANRLALFDPFVRTTFRSSALILCKTSETCSLLPRSCRAKSRVMLELGIDAPKDNYLHTPAMHAAEAERPFRLLYVGRLIYWKGLHLALAALALLVQKLPQVKMTVVGSGPDEKWVHDHALRLGLMDAVEWHAWLPREQVLTIYRDHDVFLFPSLHDSSGNVVLEALSNGLPVVCLDLGGPAVIVDDSCGVIVSTRQRSEEEVVRCLTARLEALLMNEDLRNQLAEGALLRAQQFQWADIVSRLYGDLAKQFSIELYDGSKR